MREGENVTGFSDELYHFGILGMKWGIRRTPEQLGRKAAKKKAKAGRIKAKKEARDEKIRKKYKNVPNADKINKAVAVGTLLGGPAVGVAAGLVANSKWNGNTKISKLNKNTIAKGREVADDILSTETDEQKITRLAKEGKIDLNSWDYVFDQNGRLFSAAPKRK